MWWTGAPGSSSATASGLPDNVPATTGGDGDGELPVPVPKSLGTAFAALLQKGVGALVVASLASTRRMVRPSFVAAENRSARHDLAHHRM